MNSYRLIENPRKPCHFKVGDLVVCEGKKMKVVGGYPSYANIHTKDKRGYVLFLQGVDTSKPVIVTESGSIKEYEDGDNPRFTSDIITP